MAPPYGDNDGSDQQPAGLLAANFGTDVMLQPCRLHLSAWGLIPRALP
ncbi:MAG: hypothetical protein IKG81_06010 [Bacteroidales bacterium]|nr:hypothetical protein [Bacteroidales bacterium]